MMLVIIPLTTFIVDATIYQNIDFQDYEEMLSSQGTYSMGKVTSTWCDEDNPTFILW